MHYALTLKYTLGNVVFCTITHCGLLSAPFSIRNNPRKVASRTPLLWCEYKHEGRCAENYTFDGA